MAALESMVLLIEAGADAQAAADAGQTPLQVALRSQVSSSRQKRDVMGLLIAAGCPIPPDKHLTPKDAEVARAYVTARAASLSDDTVVAVEAVLRSVLNQRAGGACPHRAARLLRDAKAQVLHEALSKFPAVPQVVNAATAEESDSDSEEEDSVEVAGQATAGFPQSVGMAAARVALARVALAVARSAEADAAARSAQALHDAARLNAEAAVASNRPLTRKRAREAADGPAAKAARLAAFASVVCAGRWGEIMQQHREAKVAQREALEALDAARAAADRIKQAVQAPLLAALTPRSQ